MSVQELRPVPAIDDAVDALALTPTQKANLKCALKRPTNAPLDATSCNPTMTGSIATGSVGGMTDNTCFTFFRIDVDSEDGGGWSDVPLAV